MAVKSSGKWQKYPGEISDFEFEHYKCNHKDLIQSGTVTGQSPGQFLASSKSCSYHWISKLVVATHKLEVWEKSCMGLFLFWFRFWYYISFSTELYTVFSCEKTLSKITHDRNAISKFSKMVLWSFMITTRARLLLNKSGARPSSNWVNFRHSFFGETS